MQGKTTDRCLCVKEFGEKAMLQILQDKPIAEDMDKSMSLEEGFMV
jgi:hypothetical protein